MSVNFFTTAQVSLALFVEYQELYLPSLPVISSFWRKMLSEVLTATLTDYKSGLPNQTQTKILADKNNTASSGIYF